MFIMIMFTMVMITMFIMVMFIMLTMDRFIMFTMVIFTMVMFIMIMFIMIFMVVTMSMAKVLQVHLLGVEPLTVSHPVPVPMSAVAVPPHRLQPRHQAEAQQHGQRAQQPGHPVLGQLVPGQHLEEGDVEEGAGCQTLEHSDQQNVAPGGILHVQGHKDPDEDSQGSVEAEHHHVHQDLHLVTHGNK